MNVHDSRRIEEVLAEHHYVETHDPNEANLILFNTCSVREKAEHKLLSVLGTLRSLKSLRPDLVLCVAGCVAQQEGDALLRRVPWIDIVLGPDNIPELPLLIERALDGHPPIARTVFDVEAPAFLVATAQECLRIDVSSFVTVMKGCDERCTFCVVPYTRGPERYRPADDIVHEIRDMARSGTREITLLGQTVNSWFEPGTEDTCERSQFAGLLTRIACEVPELSRLRYTSPHPRHVTDELAIS